MGETDAALAFGNYFCNLVATHRLTTRVELFMFQFSMNEKGFFFLGVVVYCDSEVLFLCKQM